VKRMDKTWLTLSLITTFFATGIPFWLVPYNNANLPGSLLHSGLFVAGISALLLCMYGIASFWRSTSMVAASVGASVVARVLVGAAQDPTTHNLWPFEVAIALMVGCVCAAVGAIVGSLIAKLRPSHPGEERS
jgi:hypothetical protein